MSTYWTGLLHDGDSREYTDENGAPKTTRIAGLLAPEVANKHKGSAGEYVGTEARDYGKGLMSDGFTPEPSGGETYGRTLERVKLADGRDYATAMVKSGYADADAASTQEMKNAASKTAWDYRTGANTEPGNAARAKVVAEQGAYIPRKNVGAKENPLSVAEEVGNSVVSGAHNLARGGAGLVQAAGELAGSEPVFQYGKQLSRDIRGHQKPYERTVNTFDKATESGSNFAKYWGGAIGESGVNFAPVLTGGLAGARVGAMIGGVPGAAIGGVVGGVGGAVLNQFGMLEDTKTNHVSDDGKRKVETRGHLGSQAGMALGLGILDKVGLDTIAAPFIGRGVTGLAKTMLAKGGVESGIEATQTTGEEAFAHRADPSHAFAPHGWWPMVKESAIQGFLGSSGLSLPGAVMDAMKHEDQQAIDSPEREAKGPNKGPNYSAVAAAASNTLGFPVKVMGNPNFNEEGVRRYSDQSVVIGKHDETDDKANAAAIVREHHEDLTTALQAHPHVFKNLESAMSGLKDTEDQAVDPEQQEAFKKGLFAKALENTKEGGNFQNSVQRLLMDHKIGATIPWSDVNTETGQPLGSPSKNPELSLSLINLSNAAVDAGLVTTENLPQYIDTLGKVMDFQPSPDAGPEQRDAKNKAIEQLTKGLDPKLFQEVNMQHALASGTSDPSAKYVDDRNSLLEQEGVNIHDEDELRAGSERPEGVNLHAEQKLKTVLFGSGTSLHANVPQYKKDADNNIVYDELGNRIREPEDIRRDLTGKGDKPTDLGRTSTSTSPEVDPDTGAEFYRQGTLSKDPVDTDKSEHGILFKGPREAQWSQDIHGKDFGNTTFYHGLLYDGPSDQVGHIDPNLIKDIDSRNTQHMFDKRDQLIKEGAEQHYIDELYDKNGMMEQVYRPIEIRDASGEKVLGHVIGRSGTEQEADLHNFDASVQHMSFVASSTGAKGRGTGSAAADLHGGLVASDHVRDNYIPFYDTSTDEKLPRYIDPLIAVRLGKQLAGDSLGHLSGDAKDIRGFMEFISQMASNPRYQVNPKLDSDGNVVPSRDGSGESEITGEYVLDALPDDQVIVPGRNPITIGSLKASSDTLYLSVAKHEAKTPEEGALADQGIAEWERRNKGKEFPLIGKDVANSILESRGLSKIGAEYEGTDEGAALTQWASRGKALPFEGDQVAFEKQLADKLIADGDTAEGAAKHVQETVTTDNWKEKADKLFPVFNDYDWRTEANRLYPSRVGVDETASPMTKEEFAKNSEDGPFKGSYDDFLNRLEQDRSAQNEKQGVIKGTSLEDSNFGTTPTDQGIIPDFRSARGTSNGGGPAAVSDQFRVAPAGEGVTPLKAGPLEISPEQLAERQARKANMEVEDLASMTPEERVSYEKDLTEEKNAEAKQSTEDMGTVKFDNTENARHKAMLEFTPESKQDQLIYKAAVNAVIRAENTLGRKVEGKTPVDGAKGQSAVTGYARGSNAYDSALAKLDLLYTKMSPSNGEDLKVADARGTVQEVVHVPSVATINPGTTPSNADSKFEGPSAELSERTQELQVEAEHRKQNKQYLASEVARYSKMKISDLETKIGEFNGVLAKHEYGGASIEVPTGKEKTQAALAKIVVQNQFDKEFGYGRYKGLAVEDKDQAPTSEAPTSEVPTFEVPNKLAAIKDALSKLVPGSDGTYDEASFEEAKKLYLENGGTVTKPRPDQVRKHLETLLSGQMDMFADQSSENLEPSAKSEETKSEEQSSEIEETTQEPVNNKAISIDDLRSKPLEGKTENNWRNKFVKELTEWGKQALPGKPGAWSKLKESYPKFDFDTIVRMPKDSGYTDKQGAYRPALGFTNAKGGFIRILEGLNGRGGTGNYATVMAHELGHMMDVKSIDKDGRRISDTLTPEEVTALRSLIWGGDIESGAAKDFHQWTLPNELLAEFNALRHVVPNEEIPEALRSLQGKLETASKNIAAGPILENFDHPLPKGVNKIGYKKVTDGINPAGVNITDMGLTSEQMMVGDTSIMDSTAAYGRAHPVGEKSKPGGGLSQDPNAIAKRDHLFRLYQSWLSAHPEAVDAVWKGMQDSGSYTLYDTDFTPPGATRVSKARGNSQIIAAILKAAATNNTPIRDLAYEGLDEDEAFGDEMYEQNDDAGLSALNEEQGTKVSEEVRSLLALPKDEYRENLDTNNSIVRTEAERLGVAAPEMSLSAIGTVLRAKIKEEDQQGASNEEQGAKEPETAAELTKKHQNESDALVEELYKNNAPLDEFQSAQNELRARQMEEASEFFRQGNKEPETKEPETKAKKTAEARIREAWADAKGLEKGTHKYDVAQQMIKNAESDYEETYGEKYRTGPQKKADAEKAAVKEAAKLLAEEQVAAKNAKEAEIKADPTKADATTKGIADKIHELNKQYPQLSFSQETTKGTERAKIKGNHVTLYSNNLKTISDVQDAIDHEVMGHAAMLFALGKEKHATILARIFDSTDSHVQALRSNIEGLYSDESVRPDELVAMLAESARAKRLVPGYKVSTLAAATKAVENNPTLDNVHNLINAVNQTILSRWYDGDYAAAGLIENFLTGMNDIGKNVSNKVAATKVGKVGKDVADVIGDGLGFADNLVGKAMFEALGTRLRLMGPKAAEFASRFHHIVGEAGYAKGHEGQVLEDTTDNVEARDRQKLYKELQTLAEALPSRTSFFKKLVSKSERAADEALEADYKAVYRANKTGDLTGLSPRAKKMEKLIREFQTETLNPMLKSMYDTLRQDQETTNGVVEGGFTDTIPTYINQELWAKDEDKIINILITKGGMTARDAKALWSRKAAAVSLVETDLLKPLTSSFGSWNDIPKGAREALVDYYDDNIMQNLTNYIHAATKRGVLDQQMGKWVTSKDGKPRFNATFFADEAADSMSAEDRHTFTTKIMPALMGTLGSRMSPELRTTNSWALTFLNTTLLPLSVFAQPVDIGGIAIRDEHALRVAGHIGKLMVNKKFRDQMIKEANEALPSLHRQVADMLSGSGMGVFTSKAAAVNNAFFRMNQMQRWSEFSRILGYTVGKGALVRYAKQVEGKDLEARKRGLQDLAELNLTAKEVNDWIEAGQPLDEKFAIALNKWVDGAVIKPGASIRPIYHSDASKALLAYLHSYTNYSHETFGKRIAYNVSRRTGGARFMPLAIAAGTMIPLVVAGASLRAAISNAGGDDEEKKKRNVLADFMRTGLLGSGAQTAYDLYAAQEHGGSMLAALTVPTSVLEQMLKTLYIDENGWPEWDEQKALAQNMPIANKSKIFRDLIGSEQRR